MKKGGWFDPAALLVCIDAAPRYGSFFSVTFF